MKKIVKQRATSKVTNARKDNSQQILTAAENLFADRGYSGTTISAIAEAVGLPKANILYYFKTKEQLYQAVLEQLLTLWMQNMNEMTEESHPKDALPKYIESKIKQSQEFPNASRIFAAEMLHGSHRLRTPLQTELKEQFKQTCHVLQVWQEKGWIDPINPEHLIFMLWSTTQAYADHGIHNSLLMGKEQLEEEDFLQGTELITQVILKGCGVK